MTTSTRGKLGGAILSASIIAAIGLSVSGVPLVTVERSRSETTGDGSFVWFVGFDLHWPLVAVLAAGVTGLVLLVRRKHEKRNG